eukprot:TRINITY_DN9245_c0_g2_i1.p1 TRINITY_DN9245_c0_g2~~TRINITY_DN9245_c0_g2_i1.p1  ORF type:complete len:786 (-),score=54.17 TRINITY_DN9245_c0_g2_i1:31-2388(-)
MFLNKYSRIHKVLTNPCSQTAFLRLISTNPTPQIQTQLSESDDIPLPERRSHLEKQIKQSNSYQQFINILHQNKDILTVNIVKNTTDHITDKFSKQKFSKNKIDVGSIIDFLVDIQNFVNGRSLSQFLSYFTKFDVQQAVRSNFQNDRRLFELIQNRMDSILVQDAIDILSALIKLKSTIGWDSQVTASLFQQISKKQFKNLNAEGVVIICNTLLEDQQQFNREFDEQIHNLMEKTILDFILGSNYQFDSQDLIIISKLYSNLPSNSNIENLYQKILQRSLLVFSGFSNIDSLIELLGNFSKWNSNLSDQIKSDSLNDLETLFECSGSVFYLNIDDLSTSQIIQIVDIYESCELIDQHLFEQFAQRTSKELPIINDHDLGILLKGFSQENLQRNYKCQDDENISIWETWFHDAFENVKIRIQNMSDENFANCVFGLARGIGYQPNKLEFWQNVISKIKELLLQGLNEDVLFKITQTIKFLQNNTQNNEIYQCPYDQDFYEQLGVGILQLLTYINAKTIVETLEIFHNARHSNLNQLNQLVDDVIDQCDKIDLILLIKAAWYFAQLGVSHDSPIFDVVQRKSRNNFQYVQNIEDLQQLMWVAAYSQLWRRKLWWKEIFKYFNFLYSSNDQTINYKLLFQVQCMLDGHIEIESAFESFSFDRQKIFNEKELLIYSSSFIQQVQLVLQSLCDSEKIVKYQRLQKCQFLELFCCGAFNVDLKDGKQVIVILAPSELVSQNDDNVSVGQLKALISVLKQENILVVKQPKLDELKETAQKEMYMLQQLYSL